MKVVQISKKALVLGSVRLTKPSLTLGRSPTCDFVLRAKGVKPVHFLLEWMGTGDFDSNQGHWSLFDISQTQGEEQAHKAVEGIILSKSKNKVGLYQFQLEEEKLAETELSRRILKEAYFDVPPPQISRAGMGSFSALEMVDVHIPSDAIVNISHYSNVKKSDLLRGALPLEIKWSESSKDFIEIHLPNLSAFKVFNKGEPVVTASSQLDLKRGDLIQIRAREHDYFLRIVDWIFVEKAKKQWVQDPIFRWMAAAILVFLGLGYYLLNVAEIKVESKPPPPVRVARVDVVEVPKPVVKPPPPPPRPVVEEKKPEVAPPPVIKHEITSEKKDAATKAAPSRVRRDPEKPPKAGLNSVAKKADVNAVGLLSAVKKSNPNTISADQVMNEVIVSDVAEGKGPAKVVIEQSASGVIGVNSDKVKKTGGNLVEASSTLSGVEVEDSHSTGGLAVKGGTGEGLGLALKGKLEKSLGSGSGTTDGGTFSESISGGLTKDQIRKALAAHRREIRACYEKALLVSSRIGGRVAYKWHISPSGSVTSIQTLKSELNLPQLEECVSGVIKDINFPESLSGQPTTVLYPFVFQSGNNGGG